MAQSLIIMQNQHNRNCTLKKTIVDYCVVFLIYPQCITVPKLAEWSRMGKEPLF